MEILYSVLNKRKEFKANYYEIFEAHEIPNVEELDTSTMDMIEKLARVGELLDQSLEMAYTDSVSGLPNMNAALRYLNDLNEKMDQPNFVFSIFIIDGDNLGQYNKISYQQGDYMIKKLGEILKQDFRPHDFVARWRSGDEFFAVLPEVGLEEAIRIGNRLRERIKLGSKDWQFPVTISIGIVSYPNNGKTITELIDLGERALRDAKKHGKDCVATIN
jgi:diguanylate cyclase (GGDEF)-like protein